MIFSVILIGMAPQVVVAGDPFAMVPIFRLRPTAMEYALASAEKRQPNPRYNPNMLALERTFIDALLKAAQDPSEETKHVATESLRDLLNMYQEDTLKKVATTAEKSVVAEAHGAIASSQ